MTTLRMGEEGLRWFIARVEDINDPEKLGRVKIRVLNEHDSPSITTDELPWAYPLTPITSASYQQVGRSPTGLLVGSTVFGFYLDGQEKQIPVLWGSYAKMPGKDQSKNDVPGLARELNTISKEQFGPEPPSAYDAKYPFNHVWQTQSGHVIEVDDSPDASRLHVYHKSGTYIEVNNDGQKVTKVVDKDFEIVVKDKTVYVGGNLNIEVKGNVTLKVDGSVDGEVKGDTNLTVDGSVTGNVKGDTSLTIDGSFTGKASSWNITGDITLEGKMTSTGDVIANGISLDNHKHSDPQGGTTGTPS